MMKVCEKTNFTFNWCINYLFIYYYYFFFGGGGGITDWFEVKRLFL